MTLALFVIALFQLAAVPSELPPRPNEVLADLQEERWSEARPILEGAREANPYDGRTRLYLGIAYQGLGRHREAIDELEAALRWGVTGNRRGMQLTHLALARSCLATGDSERGLAHLERAWADWSFDGVAELLEDERYSLLHSDPRLRQLAGLDRRADAGDRVARWRADLRHFRRLLRAAHPSPFHSIAAERWEAEADRVGDEIPSLEDREVVAEFLRLAALIGDGHTAVYPPTDGAIGWQILPFIPVRMSDGWFVAATPPEHADLVGGRVVASGGRSLDVVLDFLRERLPRDNEFTENWLLGWGLQFAPAHALAVGGGDADSVLITVERADGTQISRELVARAADRNPNSHWVPSDWILAADRAPRWTREPDRIFHHEYVADSGVIYARILQTADTAEMSLAAYGQELRGFMEKHEGAGLVLDLRLNNGGDANEARDLLDELIRIPALETRGSLAVLIGPRTYSATGYVLGMLEKHLEPIFVGWPSGCRPVNYSSERAFRLPYSGLTGAISYELRVDGGSTDDRRPAFFPDYVVWPSGEDLRRGRDPVLESALRILE